jgi:hypothetical protein
MHFIRKQYNNQPPKAEDAGRKKNLDTDGANICKFFVCFWIMTNWKCTLISWDPNIRM